VTLSLRRYRRVLGPFISDRIYDAFGYMRTD
jgi:hypothetical protein